MIKKLVLLVCLLFLSTSKVSATEFTTSYDVLYDVDENGITTVTEKINLKNLTSEYYAQQFKLTIGASEIFDIKAQDNKGNLAVSQEQKDGVSSINVKFNQQVVGIGKELPWSISFKSKDFAQKLGKVWEIRVPRIADPKNLGNYNLTMAVPQSFGESSLMMPVPLRQTLSQGKVFMVFDKEQLISSGISASFGQNQFFDFNLTYHLQNNNLMPILTNIALPPDTAYQDVIFQRIKPSPVNVTLDNDGNYLAWFRLNRGQKINVSVIGSAKLYTSSKVKEPYLDKALREKYIQPSRYWERNNPQIKARLSDILEGKENLSSNEKVKKIYQFVVNFLKYDPARLKNNERMGAAASLNDPTQAVCMEFTDLFIALTRAAGIPSRELDGYAYTTNSKLRPASINNDVLHAWPEYWDDSVGWVMVDPTWENTTGGVDYFNKLDLNHFVFAIKGHSSESPIPAGLYKQENNTTDVKVNISSSDFLGHPQIDAQIEPIAPIFSGFPVLLRVKVTNNGNSFFPSTPITLKASKLLVENGKQDLGVIPAYGAASYDFKVKTKSILDYYNGEVEVLIGERRFTKQINIYPFILFRLNPILIAGLIAVMVLIYLIIFGVLLYRRKIKKLPKKEK